MTEPKKPSNAGTWIVIIIIWFSFSWWWSSTPTSTPVSAAVADHEDSLTRAEVEDAVTDGTQDLRDALSQLEQQVEDQEYELRRLRSELDDTRTR